MERDLELLLEVTESDLERWDDDREVFAINSADGERMSPEEKLAYVAKLVYWLAIDYGVSPGGGRAVER